MLLTRNMNRQAGLAVALLNIALPGHAGGRPYNEPKPEEVLRKFLELVSPATREEFLQGPEVATRLRALADLLQPVFAAESEAEAAEKLNALMRRFGARPYLTDDVGQPFHLHFDGNAETAVESLGGEFAVSLALLIDHYGTRRFGLCQARLCDRVYVDLTRNGSRRFCSEDCSARSKMANYRARLRP